MTISALPAAESTLPKSGDVAPEPAWTAEFSDRLWQSAALRLWNEAERQRSQLTRRIQSAQAELHRLFPQEDWDIVEIPEQEVKTRGTYGTLPTLLVDQGYGAIFPVPMRSPHRFSWFQIAHDSAALLRALRPIDARLQRPITELHDAFRLFQNQWDKLTPRFVAIAQSIRYLETWKPLLLEEWNNSRHRGARPTAYTWMQAAISKDPKIYTALRELLRPARVIHRAFFPEGLEGLPTGILTLPIVTDISSPRFLREVEGALQTHWNQSTWAKSEKVTFQIQWQIIPEDRELIDGRIALAEHLRRFPADKVGITTGGLTTFVKENVLVLGPSHTTPRTLAHELGHLIGFSDCYMRTLSTQGWGLAGLAVLEWDNPIYPDDLMCDNSVGHARAERW